MRPGSRGPFLEAGVLAAVCAGCGPAVVIPVSPRYYPVEQAESPPEAKAEVAVAHAAAAGVLQAEETAARQALRDVPPHPAACPGQAMAGCYVAWHDRREDGPASDDLAPAEIREYVRAFIDGLRALQGLPPLVLDPELSTYAQAGSEQLSRDHLAHAHLEQHPCGGCAEVQGPPEGMWPAPVEQQIDTILSVMMREGPGGAHHDALLSPGWHRLGVGVVAPGGEMYFTADFAP